MCKISRHNVHDVLVQNCCRQDRVDEKYPGKLATVETVVYRRVWLIEYKGGLQNNSVSDVPAKFVQVFLLLILYRYTHSTHYYVCIIIHNVY